MITYYLTDENNVFTKSCIISPYSSLPRGTVTPPPQVAEGEFAQLFGDTWITITKYPDLSSNSNSNAAMANVTDSVVTRRQAKQALLQVGLLDDVDAAIAASGDRAAQIDWADATEFRRDWPTLIALQPALGLTDQQIDDLFREAAKL